MRLRATLAALALGLAALGQARTAHAGTILGGVDLGDLTDHHMVFTDGSVKANWQGSSKGFVGDVAVNGVLAVERSSGTVPYAGTIYTSAPDLGQWQAIVDANPGQASASYGEVARLNGLSSDLTSAFTQIDALTATAGYGGVASTFLDGLNTQNGIAETFVIDVTSGFQVSTLIDITGDAGDIFILRWDQDRNAANGYGGQVKFQSGGGINPLGGLTAGNFVHVAGDINASGGGSNPLSPFPQGPRLDGGTGALIAGGQDFSGGGFFTGYWLTTGQPSGGKTSSLSNAIFVGGWYSSTTEFSLTSGSSGVYVPPPVTVPLPAAATPGLVGLALVGLVQLRRRRRA